MRIGFDIRSLVEGEVTGVGEYAGDFLRKLIKENPQDQFLLFYNSFRPIKTNLDWLEKYDNVSIKAYSFPNKIFNFLFWFLGWPKIDVLLGGVDVFFAPNISFLAVSKKCRLVLTVHDLSFERFPEFFSFKRRLWHFIINPRKMCQQADLILTVSQSTKNDLVSFYQLTESKIELVVPIKSLAGFLDAHLSAEKKAQVQKRYNLPKRYVLYLGTIEPRKNLVNLIKAFEILKRQDSNADLKLVLAGRLGWKYNHILNKVHDSQFREDIIFLGYVKKEDKAAVYAQAQVFVFPSFFEGFGFPVAEAMATGVPVVTSNCSSLPEVAQEGAVLVDPYQTREIAQAIGLLLENEALRRKYIKKGKAQAVGIDQASRKQPKTDYFL